MRLNNWQASGEEQKKRKRAPQKQRQAKARTKALIKKLKAE